MHYTSIENIHKVIDPLFMDELNAEFGALHYIMGNPPLVGFTFMTADQKGDMEQYCML